MCKRGNMTEERKEKTEAEIKIETLAREVLNLSKNILTVNLRFMDIAINRLEMIPYEGTICTNAEAVYFDPMYVLSEYQKDSNIFTSNYLHIILHCVFRHYMAQKDFDEDIWNLACDIAVENVINELNISCLEHRKRAFQRNIINKLKTEITAMTAEKIYKYFISKNIHSSRIKNIHKYFKVDDHSLWYKGSSENSFKEDNKGSDDENENDEFWKKAASKISVDLETFSKDKGDALEEMVQNLKAVHKDRYDYSSFLKKFSSLSETIKINDEEFDYIFYSYGLSVYENMPLIEPLEYKEEKLVKEFVIAIDTSGSVEGDVVQNFIEKTYNILMQEESFSKKINIYIIQCDDEIRESIKITSKEEFEGYLNTMEIKGLGSTDFRPVFEYVNDLKRKGEFKSLNGLIYFTDGYGKFPKNKPDYKSAFVFLKDDYSKPDIPIWGIRHILEVDDLRK